MPIAPVTVTLNLADHLGERFDARRTKVWVTTNIPGDRVVDTTDGQIRLGGGQVVLGADGTASVDMLPTDHEGLNPTDYQVYFNFDWVDSGTRERKRDRLGPFSVTEDCNLADLIAEQEVPPTYLSQVTADLQAMIDQGLKGPQGDEGPQGAPGGSDAETAQRVTDGPLTKAALSASIVGARNSRARVRHRLAWWFAALAKRDSACATVWVCGDSNGEAAGSPTRWLDLMATGLVSKYPTTGVTGYGRYYPARHENTGTPSPWTYKAGDGTVAADTRAFDTTGNHGFGGRSVALPKLSSGGLIQWMEMSVSTPGYVSVMVPTGEGSGAVQVFLGEQLSTASLTFTPGATEGEGSSNAIVPTADPQVIRVAAQASNTPIKVNGLLVRPTVSNKGINVIDASHAGWSAATYAAKQVTERPTLAYLAGMSSALMPDLVILPLTINSYVLGESPESMTAGLTAIMDAIRNATVGGRVSFLIVAQVDPGTAARDWSAYADAAEALADADTHGPGGSSAVEVLRLDDYMVAPAVDNNYGLMAADKIHWTDPAGHRLMADLVLDKIA